MQVESWLTSFQVPSTNPSQSERIFGDTLYVRLCDFKAVKGELRGKGWGHMRGQPAWQAFERKGEGNLDASPYYHFALLAPPESPCPFLFKRLPRRFIVTGGYFISFIPFDTFLNALGHPPSYTTSLVLNHFFYYIICTLLP